MGTCINICLCISVCGLDMSVYQYVCVIVNSSLLSTVSSLCEESAGTPQSQQSQTDLHAVSLSAC